MHTIRKNVLVTVTTAREHTAFFSIRNIYLRPRHCIGQEEEPNHGVCKGLDAACVDILSLVAVQKIVRPAVYLCWCPVLACICSYCKAYMT